MNVEHKKTTVTAGDAKSGDWVLVSVGGVNGEPISRVLGVIQGKNLDVNGQGRVLIDTVGSVPAGTKVIIVPKR